MTILLSNLVVPFLFYFFILELDGFNITLGNTNVTYEYFIVTNGGFLIFFTHVEWFQHLTDVYCTDIIYDHTIAKFGGSYFFTQIEWSQRHIG